MSLKTLKTDRWVKVLQKYPTYRSCWLIPFQGNQMSRSTQAVNAVHSVPIASSVFDSQMKGYEFTNHAQYDLSYEFSRQQGKTLP